MEPEPRRGGFGAGYGAWLSALLAFGGILTALPLIGFICGTQVPLATVGVMRYFYRADLQSLIGVFVFPNPSTARG